MPDVTLGIAFFAGLLSFISPCVLPLVPAYIGYMGGRLTHAVALQTSAQMQASAPSVAQRINLFVHGAAFVAGFTLVFVSVGLMTTAFVGLLGSTATLLTDVLARAGGVLIILFGLHFMGALRAIFRFLRQQPALLGSPIFTLAVGAALSALLVWALIEPLVALPFLAALWLWLFLGNGFLIPRTFWSNTLDRIEAALYSDTRRELNPREHSGLMGSFIMGLVFSAGWTPCIGPIYGTILTVAANTGDVGYAAPLLMSYSLGLGVPFLAMTLLLGQAQTVLRRLQRHIRTFERVTGALLVIIGITVASGQMTRLTQVLSTDFADFSLRVEECGVGVVQGHLALNQAGACFSGTLKLVSLNQGISSTLDAATPTREFVFQASAGQGIRVEFSRVSAGFAPTVTLNDSSGSPIASTSQWAAASEGTFIAFDPLTLPADGLYTLVVSGTPGEFRVRIAREGSASSGTPSISGIVAQGGPLIGIEKGNLAPDFSVTTMNGETLRLKDLQDSVVVLNFWGTWCAPCLREVPELQQAFQQYSSSGLIVLGIAVRDTPEKVSAFAQAHGLSYPLAIDETFAITELYAITGQPSTIIIGRDGTIVEKYYSVVTSDTLIPVLADALKAS